MKAEALNGLPVVSIADSTVVGHVDDLLFEPQERRVAIVEIVAAGQRARIPFAAVHHVGHDAVTIPGVGVVQWLNPTSIPPEQAGLLRLGDMAKLTVIDEAGAVLGKVSGVEIEPEDGRISEVRTHQGGVLGIGGRTHRITGAQIQSASGELMVVAVQEEPVTEPPPREAAEDEAERRVSNDGGPR